MRVPSSLIATGLALGLLAACDTSAPYSNIIDTSGRGVGFSDYAQYMRAQEELSRIRRAEAAQARNVEVPPGAPRYGQTVQANGQSGGSASIGQEAVAAVRGNAQGASGSTQPQQDFPIGQASAPAQDAQPGAPLTAMAPQPPAGAGESLQTASAAPSQSADVSDQGFTPQPFGTPQQNRLVERDFVPQVRVSDAEMGAGDTPNLFVYALSTTHNVGEQRYERRNPLRFRRSEAACAQFPSQDLAQEAFLAAGGPERDPNHLDPDGDGFACWWDPAPFRQAARNVRARE